MRRTTTIIALILTAMVALVPASAGCNFPEDPSMSQEAECSHGKEGSPQAGKSLGMPDEARWVVAGLSVVAFAGVAFALRSLWWPRTRLIVGPLFARLTRRDVTEHPLRARILKAVADRPGITAADLAAHERINAGTLDYHLDVLERDGQLRTAKAGRNRLLFLPGAGADVEALAELSAQGRGDVARLILQEPGIHAAAIAERLDLTRATVHHHLARLEAAGLVRIERGLRVRCHPTDRLPRVIEPPRRRRLAVLSDPRRDDAPTSG
jgi:DNA-binding MarR family transcriptional regulator